MTDLINEVPQAFLQLTETEKLFPMSITGSYYGPRETYEARTAVAALTGLINAASKAQNATHQALSYRNYNVGSTAIMTNFETREMAYIHGFNVKTSPGESDLNIHAEQMAIAKGRFNGLNRVIGISVAADATDADANPNNYPTLPPCGRCVKMFEAIPEVDNNTLVLGVNPDYSQCQLYTVGSLLDSTVDPLVAEPFSLRTEEDLDVYDDTIKPFLVHPLLKMYGALA